MTLVAVRARALTLAFRRPLTTAGGPVRERRGVLLEVEDEDGCRGYGEAAPWPGFATESPEEALARLQQAAAELTGARWDRGEPPPLAALTGAPAATAAMAGALLDLEARRAGLPLAALLARTRDDARVLPLPRVAANALLLQGQPDALRAEAAQVRASGFAAAKLKLGGASLQVDLQRVMAAREGLGAEIELRGDANGCWTEAEARTALEALAPGRLAWVEQPVAATDLDALSRLRRHSPARIAADESLAVCGLDRVLDAGAADVVVLKPAMLGGAARALVLAERAREAGCTVVFTHAMESAIGAHHVLHCAAAWGDAAVAHGVLTAGLFEQDVAAAVSAPDGSVDVPTAPGLGVVP